MAMQLNDHRRRRYFLGEHMLDPDRRLLVRNGDIIHLPNKPFQVLLYLIEHRDRIVTRQELLDQFWDGKDVYDDTLRKAVGTIRKALGDRVEGTRFVETRHREGYRYVGPLEEESIEDSPAAIEIEKTRGVRIVIEEEDSQEPAELPVVALPVTAPAHKRRAALTVALAASFAAIALAAAAAMFYRNRPAALSDHTKPFPIRSIAVLPLRNLSDDPQNEYFADGLSENFITELSKISGLKVISRSSAFTFKGKEVDPREAGRLLGVGAILEGSVRRSGDTVRVETRLVSAEDGRVLWAGNTFDRSLKDIFAVQDEISCSVAANLRVVLCAEGVAQPTKRYTDNVDAYDSLLKSLYFYNKRTPEGLKKAIEYAEESVRLDPRYAPAYANLASDYLMSVWFPTLDSKGAVAKARKAATRALEIDETYVGAHIVMSSILGYEWDWSGSRKEWERVFELDPACSDYGYAYTLLQDDADEAVRWIKRAQELDPLSLLVSTNVGQILYYARRYDEAIAQLKMVLEIDPNYALAHQYLGQAYLEKRMYDQGIDELQRSIVLSEKSPEIVANLGYAYAGAGRRGETRKVLGELSRLSKRTYVAPYLLARIYAALGLSDRAFEMLEQAYEERDSHIVDVARDPALDPIRSDPRYASLLRTIGIPHIG